MNTRQSLACLALVASLGVFCAVGHAATDAQSHWPTLLSQYGVSPITPPAPAPDFTMHDLLGREHRLSNHRGDWVLLTFFATWCGPCASEMPSLEALYQDLKGGHGPNTVHIWGIATDPENNVRGFAQGRGMSFPVLLDSQQQASRSYQASSIPTSYLIDPGGRLVGTTRGARDWQRMGAMFDALPTEAVASVAPADASPSAGATAPAPQPQAALPPDVPPPSATATLRDTPRLNQPFILDVRVVWAGQSNAYILLPPQVHTPDAVEVRSISAHTNSQAGATRIDYEVTLMARKTGAFDLDPIDIRYTPRGGDTPLVAQIMGPTIDVGHTGMRRIWEQHAKVLMGSLAGLAALTALAGAGLRWRRRAAQAPQQAEQASGRYDRARGQLQAVQRARMSGNVPAFLHQLLQIEPELDPPNHRKTLEALAEAAAYGNMRPNEEVLNQLERQAERKIQTLAPTPRGWEEQS